MSYDRLGNHSIRENGRKRSIFDKVNEIKADLKDLFPEIEGDRLIAMFSHCRRFHEGKLHYGRVHNKANKSRVRDLTANEKLLYDYLLRNNLNPSTTYRWIIATRLPPDILKQLEKGTVGQKQAMQISANRRRTKESVTGLLMLEEIRSLVGKLEWKG